MILLIPYMTWLSRMCGGGPPKLPYGLDAWLLALPYLLFFPVISYWVIPAYLGAVLGIRLGHGRGFDYSLPFKPGSEPEKVEILIPKYLPVKYQKILIMLLTGLAVVLLSCAFLLMHGHIASGLILALSGAAKALSYFLPKTLWAELARGFFLACGVYFGLMLI